MLCDYAGISSFSSNKYMSATIINDCINEEFKNPFNRTKKIVKTIDYENSKIKNKVKQK